MASEDTNGKRDPWRFFYLPLIIGLVLGSVTAAVADQWWWATVGAVAGAAIGEMLRRYTIRRGAPGGSAG